jgi:putative transposase
MIQKAFKYRLYPNASERSQIDQHFGAVRFVYNTALEMKRRYYDRVGKGLSKRKIQDQFVALKNTPEFSWLYEINSQSILAALGHVESAYQNFFQGRAQFPQFKSRKNHWQGYQCPQHVDVDFETGRVKIPKIGWVKAKLHRRFEGKIKTCTVKRNPCGHYTISVLVETPETLPATKPIKAATTRGYDLGLSHFLINDEGEKIANPRFLLHALERLGIEQKKLARKKAGSNNRSQQRLTVARRHQIVANQRHHFLHEQSSKLLSDSQVETVALEDLHIKGMIRNRRLARHIADVAWGRFVEFVEYKAQWRGKHVIRCSRWAPSSKSCHCGYVNQELSLAERQWICPVCHTQHDRDVLAAQNIKQFALVDALGMKESSDSGVCVKSSPSSSPVHAGDDAKDAATNTAWVARSSRQNIDDVWRE